MLPLRGVRFGVSASGVMFPLFPLSASGTFTFPRPYAPVGLKNPGQRSDDRGKPNVPSRIHTSPCGYKRPLADAPSPSTAPVPSRVRSYPSRILFKTLIFCALSWKSPSFIRSVVNAYSPAATPSMYSTFPNTASTSVFALSVRTKKRFSLSL